MNNVIVKCYSGHTYAEEPRSFRWQGRLYEVDNVEKAWREPGERHFLVKTRDNKTFKLCYNEGKERWSLTEVVRR
ncbi:MAG: hypothetical protein A2Z28_02745 [Chloroflexi bacterium RBG_16_51_9]|nr:MAG: hypothetical protein A2Z28_02745 [Chloroflexi bacterium RBG_16_51_9]